MNEIPNIISQKSDVSIAQDIGAYVKAMRIRKRMTQNEIALAANISRSTLSLIENGETGTVTNLIKVLRVLDQLHVFKAFELKTQISPLVLAKAAQKQRQRVKRKSKTNKEESNW